MAAQEGIIQLDIHKIYNVLMIQEPYFDFLGNLRAMSNWIMVKLTNQ